MQIRELLQQTKSFIMRFHIHKIVVLLAVAVSIYLITQTIAAERRDGMQRARHDLASVSDIPDLTHEGERTDRYKRAIPIRFKGFGRMPSRSSPSVPYKPLPSAPSAPSAPAMPRQAAISPSAPSANLAHSAPHAGLGDSMKPISSPAAHGPPPPGFINPNPPPAPGFIPNSMPASGPSMPTSATGAMGGGIGAAMGGHLPGSTGGMPSMNSGYRSSSMPIPIPIPIFLPIGGHSHHRYTNQMGSNSTLTPGFNSTTLQPGANSTTTNVSVANNSTSRIGFNDLCLNSTQTNSTSRGLSCELKVNDGYSEGGFWNWLKSLFA